MIFDATGRGKCPYSLWHGYANVPTAIGVFLEFVQSPEESIQSPQNVITKRSTLGQHLSLKPFSNLKLFS